MNADQIIAALELPAKDRRPTLWAIEEDERPEDVAQALAIAEDAHTRQLLADLLGFQAAPAGVEALIAALSDVEGRVRSAAADALGKVFMSHPDLPEREAAGAALLARAGVEPEITTRTVLLTALGTTRHEPGRATLQRALDDPDERIQKSARWALEHYPNG
ncbi:HEAT repeat domain-containing protein [Solirubrobacter ginsenosidimutans]|uniref:HEAT repeat domain-containing protein n=1 Tax=Solirubrobacter ginsenosidimutans TaxID=490573 RepID=A0A9X3S646_9ACTN|nr:HEAT repeat domain-containing protein [Solirubrobacter ginsenosidimutans]MDA0162328.1 HEAT repeat domain-containing protein [Solirubrobacter ginsenosidimutans]